MEESISGFKVRGTWADIIEHGECITRLLRDAGTHTASGKPNSSYPDAFAEWDEWRPKPHDQLEDAISEKTAEQASVDEGTGEKADESPTEDIQTAGEKLTESSEELEEDDDESPADKAGESMEHAARAADTAGRKALRKVEETVYDQVMTQISPYYFDNELVSANLEQVTTGDEEEFIFEINVNDDDLKSVISERLTDEDAID
ncbi:DUF5828 family protein [Halalkalicoccus tibetensis]|uniref:DUF5828 family protein n=1 Tax=Halalkalicoccus tibetensis TaxID=175632 RepID=A0ABD5V6B2_9EURY